MNGENSIPAAGSVDLCWLLNPLPIPGWSEAAPPLAGLEGWEMEEAVKFLQTGVTPGGKPAAPPMPEYRLNRQDATAVVAYLKSLKK
jgi:hypothetical protein